MALDPNTERGREVVSYVRVGRGMVKVTKYENEQPKSPSDTMSEKSHSSSDRSVSMPGPPMRGWLRRPGAKGSSKRAPSAHRRRSRSRSSARSLHTIRRPGGYMRSEHEVSSSGDVTPLPGREERLEPQGLFALNSFLVPGSPSVWGNVLRQAKQLSEIHSATLPGQAASLPSPGTHSWTTESEIDPAADAEMWSHITRLEDELVSRFGRGAVPQFSSLRNEKPSAPPTTGVRRDRAPALPDELVAALQREPPVALRPSEKLKQRSFEPLHLAEPPRRVYRVKSSPTLVFPLPPSSIPDWVTNTPLPTPPIGLPHGFPLSPAMMRAKAGPPPPFAPPPDFPPPPPPSRGTRSKALDTTEDSEAIAALYRVLLDRKASSRPEVGKLVGHGALRPGDAGKNRGDLSPNEPRPRGAGRDRLYGSPKEDLLDEYEGSRTPLASITMV
ncbi:hypothetical protein OPQ81_003038 [Rhizoctonia solani]|nr:hypothetical protein OPQ81_003038 [Rhizoctonia solani]